jgi:hypothetical protein
MLGVETNKDFPQINSISRQTEPMKPKDQRFINEKNINSARIISPQPATQIFHFENNFSPKEPLILTSRCYAKHYDNSPFATISDLNVPVDIALNKERLPDWFGDLSTKHNRKLNKFPARNPEPSSILTARDKKIQKITELLEEKVSVRKIYEMTGKSRTFVTSIQNELRMTEHVTLYDYENPFSIQPEGRKFLQKYFRDEGNRGKGLRKLVLDYELKFPGLRIDRTQAKMEIKRVGFIFYRTRWVKQSYYKAPQTKSELLRGA